VLLLNECLLLFLFRYRLSPETFWIRGFEVDGIGSGACPMAGFGIIVVELADCATKVGRGAHTCSKASKTYIYIKFWIMIYFTITSMSQWKRFGKNLTEILSLAAFYPFPM
jgi:hypothetical protein